MNFNLALNLLKKKHVICRYGWEWMRFARSIEESAVKKSAEWVDDYRKRFPDMYPPPDIQKESAYDNCVEVEIHEVEGLIEIKVTILEGDICQHPHPYRGTRCRFYLYLDYLPKRLIGTFEGLLEDYAFLEIKREDQEADERRLKGKMDFLARTFGEKR